MFKYDRTRIYDYNKGKSVWKELFKNDGNEWKKEKEEMGIPTERAFVMLMNVTKLTYIIDHQT